MRSKRFILVCVATACVGLSATTAHGQFYKSVARGLYLAGFSPDVAPNPITGGVDFTYSRGFSTFTGDTLNFGAGTLTLSGGMTIDGSVYKRPFPGMSLRVASSSSPDTSPVPLTYTLTIPRALETVTVTGQATFDISTTVDATGFYRRVIRVDNNGTVITDGLVETEKNIDFTLGPVDQTGNIYLEAFGGLVDLFGGPGDAIAGLPDSPPLISLSQYNADSLDDLDLDDPEQLEAYVNAALLQGITQAANDPSMTTSCCAAVPEPATVALLGMCGWLVLLRGRGVRK